MDEEKTKALRKRNPVCNDYEVLVNNELCRCLICSAEVPRTKVNISSLTFHIPLKHPTAYEAYKRKLVLKEEAEAAEVGSKRFNPLVSFNLIDNMSDWFIIILLSNSVNTTK